MEKAASPPRLNLVSIDGLLPGASNATLLARDGEGRPWVYKPERGERPLWDFHGHWPAVKWPLPAFESLGLGVALDGLADGPLAPAPPSASSKRTWSGIPVPSSSPPTPACGR